MFWEGPNLPLVCTRSRGRPIPSIPSLKPQRTEEEEEETKKPIHYAPFFDQPFEPLHKLVHSLSSLHTCLPPLDFTSTRQQILPLHHDTLSESGRFVRRGEEIGLVEEDDRRGWVDEWLEQGKGCAKRVEGPRVEKGGERKNEDLKG